MKKYVLLSAIALLAFPAMADITAMSVIPQAGEKTVYDVDNIVNITFDGDMMVVQTVDGTDRINIDNIDEIVFGIISGVEQTRDFDLNDGLNVAIRRNLLTASLDGGDITLRVFDTNGRLMDTVAANSELQYDLASLAKGSYILLVNNKALKFIR